MNRTGTATGTRWATKTATAVVSSRAVWRPSLSTSTVRLDAPGSLRELLDVSNRTRRSGHRSRALLLCAVGCRRSAAFFLRHRLPALFFLRRTSHSHNSSSSNSIGPGRVIFPRVFYLFRSPITTLMFQTFFLLGPGLCSNRAALNCIRANGKKTGPGKVFSGFFELEKEA